MAQLVGPQALKGLRFIRILNDQGIKPTKTDVNAFVEARTGLYDFDPLTESIFRRPAEYLYDARLITFQKGGIYLSQAGKAILRAADAEHNEKSEMQPVEVVGRMADPFVYAELLAKIDDVAHSTVIDPYMHPRDLVTLLQLSSVRRVLTRELRINGMERDDRTQKLRIALGARPGVELRFTPPGSKELHDRLILPQGEGESLFIGTSLGGTQVTVITRLGVDPTTALRAHYDMLWEGATPLDPIARVPVED